MSNSRGTLVIARESCRYCLADQAAALGLGAALEAYLNTPAPRREPHPTENDLAAAYSIAAEYEARQALIKSAHFTVEAYDLLDPTARAVFDVLWERLNDDHELTTGLIADLITAVRRADTETTRGARAPEQPGEFAAPLPDIPLFTIEPESTP